MHKEKNSHEHKMSGGYEVVRVLVKKERKWLTSESRPLMLLFTTAMGMEPGIGNVTQSKWDSRTLLPSHSWEYGSQSRYSISEQVSSLPKST